MRKKEKLPPGQVVQASVAIQLLDIDEAEVLANHTWAGAEEILESVNLSRHPHSAAVMRSLLDRGWEADSVTGLLLGIWMRKKGTASEIAADLLALDPAHRRTLTAMYGAESHREVVQYEVSDEGTLVQHSYAKRATYSPEVQLFPA